eukprot:TRINITY_DN13463_c0_g1_i3.p1 TRINITY_DN13463_c0_g1~~TRINITY_DN13463_c0_g1_i3.p1  ORF type:complete len:330 (+),score=44.49 TRINITY_DN13463_c0_g1_i3:73-1062(+)
MAWSEPARGSGAGGAAGSGRWTLQRGAPLDGWGFQLGTGRIITWVRPGSPAAYARPEAGSGGGVSLPVGMRLASVGGWDCSTDEQLASALCGRLAVTLTLEPPSHPTSPRSPRTQSQDTGAPAAELSADSVAQIASCHALWKKAGALSPGGVPSREAVVTALRSEGSPAGGPWGSVADTLTRSTPEGPLSWEALLGVIRFILYLHEAAAARADYTAQGARTAQQEGSGWAPPSFAPSIDWQRIASDLRQPESGQALAGAAALCLSMPTLNAIAAAAGPLALGLLALSTYGRQRSATPGATSRASPRDQWRPHDAAAKHELDLEHYSDAD